MSKSINELLGELPAWEAALAEDGHIDENNRITIREAFASPDAPILFPKVISRTLKEAAEPQLLVTPLLSTVRLGKGRSLEFPAVNAIQAAEIPEGQEYPEQALAFVKQVEGKVSKKGVKVAFTEEVIADSLWDIVGLHVRAAGRAMARFKEQIALGRFKEAATVVFDNDDGAVADTTGLDINGAANQTLTWDDVIDMAAVLMAENHVPTDFILHPLMWAVFLKDAVFHAGGANVQRAWGFKPSSKEGAVNATAPMGLNVIVSPFVSFTAKSGSDPAKSDVFLIDRNEIGSLLVKDDLSTDEWNDSTRDIRYLKLKERYDIVMLGDGEGIAVAKNVNLARNYEVQVTNQMA
ncbi:MAG TPA: phage major capsid protein [Nitrososphaera sp.]|nr:phage major capsid protein [Nitrososphaera sp.]